MNFLEQLVAEWYAYQDYFVRTNIKFGRREGGGWEGEMDVVAFHPKKRILVHVETSGDAYSWPQRRKRFQKKFRMDIEGYRSVFDFEFKKVRKIAIVSFTRPRRPIDFGDDIELRPIPEMMTIITDKMRQLNPAKTAIPERYPLLRAIQFAVWFGGSKCDG